MVKNKTEVLSNIEVVVFALFQLGGTKKKVHTEHIAVKCHKLAPDKFSWQLKEYKQFPDRAAVYHALQDARKEKYNRLVEGRGGRDVYGDREGWQITTEGIKWLKENEKRIAEALRQERPQMKMLDKNRFLKKLKNEEAFSNFLHDGNIEKVSRYNLSDLLGCPPDASFQVIRKKFEGLKTQAELVSDKQVNEFLTLCIKKFGDILNS